MDFRLKITGLDALKSKLGDLRQNQLPNALRDALNATAEGIQTAEIEKMKEVFDRPTSYTLNATYVKYASMQKLSAEVGFREFAGKGTPAHKYLSPQIYGGDRNLKRFEKALQAKGVLPQGMFAVPGKGASLNGNGNMSAAQIIQILSYFDAFGEQGYKANMTDTKRAKMAKGTKKSGSSLTYFVSKGPGSVNINGKPQHLPAGIYARFGFTWGSGIKCIIRFVKKPSYQKRFPFFETAEKYADRVFLTKLSGAVDRAIKTSK
jgi:hypothetical protein